MPRPSGNPDTATGGGSSRFKPGPGRYKTIKAAYTIQQAMTKDGAPAKFEGKDSVPQTGLQFACVECDENWRPLPLKKDGEYFEFFLKFGEKAYERGVHPGEGTSIDDVNPRDLGRTPNQLYGNTVFIPESELGNTALIPKNCGYMIFMKSLKMAAAGSGDLIKAVDSMWAPGFEGLCFEVEELRSADALNQFMKWEGRDKTNLNGPFKVVRSIQAGTGGNVSATNGHAAAVSVDDMARKVLSGLCAARKGQTVKTLSGLVANEHQAVNHFPGSQLGDVLKALPALYGEYGVKDNGDGSVSFPA